MNRILLHCCCAPCSSAILEWMLNNYVQPILYYCNPNIFPEEEYLIRKNELTKYAKKLGVEVYDDDYDHKAWLCQVEGLEDEPERGRRCLRCFKMRLLSAARKAKELGLEEFTTTLASSRWKSLDQINEAGRWAAEQVEGVTFNERNWRKGGLQERRNALLKENAFYNQQYCGCEFSMRGSHKFKAALFDLDGTLIDTEPQYTKCWAAIGRKYRPDIPDLEYLIKGTSMTSILSTYFPDDKKTQQAVVEEVHRFEAEMDFPFINGAVEFVKNLKKNGVKCAIITSSDKAKLECAMAKIPDFFALFDKVLTAEHFTASKPAPDCYLLGAKVLSEKLENCVVFEDAFTGLQAGMSSGIYTIGITSSHSADVLKDKCHHTLNDFVGIRFEDIEELKNKE